jgi:hypothetical protein
MNRWGAFRAASLALLFFACHDATDPHGARTPTPSFAASVETADDDPQFANRDVRFLFVVVGCNRVDKADTGRTSPSTANIEQLNRTFSEVAALRPLPRFLFLAGDLIYGYTTDTAYLERQLRAWRQLYETSPLAASGVTLVTIPGNHEVQDPNKIAYAAAERTWKRVMAPYLFRAGNGPHAGGADGLATDQDSLTYSFDWQRTHFVMLNTDPVGRDWSVPVHWIEADLARARERHAEHIFAIGHKPAIAYPPRLYNPPVSVEDGLGFRYPALRDEFWSSLTTNGAEAMLAAHNHVYWRTQGPGGTTWQIIAGNGGSKLENIQDPTRFYGFTLITVHKDGRVTLTSYGRDVPAAGYLASSAAYPTTIRDQGDITQP